MGYMRKRFEASKGNKRNNSFSPDHRNKRNRRMNDCEDDCEDNSFYDFLDDSHPGQDRNKDCNSED